MRFIRFSRPSYVVVSAALLLTLSGCTTFQAPVKVDNEPAYVAPSPEALRPKIALVLSGGGIRGFAHIGVIKVLEANGIRLGVDLVRLGEQAVNSQLTRILQMIADR